MTCLKGTLFMVHNSQPAQSLDSRDQVGQTSFWNGLQGHPHPNKQQYNLSLTSLKLRHTWETHTSVPLKLMETHGVERGQLTVSAHATLHKPYLSLFSLSLSLSPAVSLPAQQVMTSSVHAFFSEHVQNRESCCHGNSCCLYALKWTSNIG